LPNIKSAKKRVRTNKRNEIRNRAAKATMKSAIKRADDAIKSDDGKKAEVIKSTQSLIARTAKRGIIHRNKAARLQSRLMKRTTKSAQ
jgi:small subunit ribosomal protein S20